MYDATIELVVPDYRLMHDMVLCLTVEHLRAELGTGSLDAFDGWLLELGSGTGALAIRLLGELPRARLTAVDGRATMREALRRRLARRRGFADRCTLLEGDVRGAELGPDALLAPLRQSPGRPRRRARAAAGYDVVVSVLMLSSMAHDEKLEVFRRAHHVLRTGGAFVLADVFGFQSAELTSLALDLELTRMRKLFTRPPSELADARALDPRVRRRLARLWRRYYLDEDRAEPIDGPVATPRGRVVPGQADMLRSVGFRSVEVPYRHWRVGVVYARK